MIIILKNDDLMFFVDAHNFYLMYARYGGYRMYSFLVLYKLPDDIVRNKIRENINGYVDIQFNEFIFLSLNEIIAKEGAVFSDKFIFIKNIDANLTDNIINNLIRKEYKLEFISNFPYLTKEYPFDLSIITKGGCII